jgi:hypothetical protein
VVDVLGDAAGQYETATSLCHDYWERDPLRESEVEDLLDEAEDDEIAISITAKAGMPAQSYAPVLERRWSQYQGRSID